MGFVNSTKTSKLWDAAAAVPGALLMAGNAHKTHKTLNHRQASAPQCCQGEDSETRQKSLDSMAAKHLAAAWVLGYCSPHFCTPLLPTQLHIAREGCHSEYQRLQQQDCAPRFGSEAVDPLRHMLPPLAGKARHNCLQ